MTSLRHSLGAYLIYSCLLLTQIQARYTPPHDNHPPIPSNPLPPAVSSPLQDQYPLFAGLKDASPTPDGRDSNKPSDNLTIRNATFSDLDVLTEIYIDGNNGSAVAEYIYPYRFEYSLDYAHWTKRMFEQWIEGEDRYIVMLAELDGRPVSLAVWDMDMFSPSQIDFGFNTRRDTNKSHARAFRTAEAYQLVKYFSKHGDDQSYLELLITRRNGRRHWAASMLVKWGIDLGRPTTLCASRMGQLVYTSLGFTVAGPIHIQIDGDADKLDENAMEYIPRRDG